MLLDRTCFGLGSGFVQNGGVGPGCDPAPGSARRLRDADKENRIAARGGRHRIELSAKLGITMDAQRPRAGVVHRLIAGAGVADQRASHRGDRPGGAAEDRAVNHEPVDFPRHSSSLRSTWAKPPRVVQGNVPLLMLPTGLSTFRAVNYADDPVPAHGIVLACER